MIEDSRIQGSLYYWVVANLGATSSSKLIFFGSSRFCRYREISLYWIRGVRSRFAKPEFPVPEFYEFLAMSFALCLFAIPSCVSTIVHPWTQLFHFDRVSSFVRLSPFSARFHNFFLERNVLLRLIRDLIFSSPLNNNSTDARFCSTYAYARKKRYRVGVVDWRFVQFFDDLKKKTRYNVATKVLIDDIFDVNQKVILYSITNCYGRLVTSCSSNEYFRGSDKGLKWQTYL